MKTVKIKFGIGYGRHDDEMEFEDDATPEEIEQAVMESVMQRVDWSYTVDGELA